MLGMFKNLSREESSCLKGQKNTELSGSPKVVFEIDCF